MKFDDYILRAIEQLSEAIASIVGALKRDKPREAEEQLQTAYDSLLAGDRVFLGMVDSATLANLLGSAPKVRALAQLSALEARIARQDGDAARAEQLAKRARELLAIAHRDDPQDGDDTLLTELE